MTAAAHLENRVIIHAPIGKDGRLIAQVLATAGVVSTVSASAPELMDQIGNGASAIVIAQEALTPELLRPLSGYLKGQASWSDIPLIILSTRGIASEDLRQLYGQLGNVTLLERPVQSVTLISAATAALRARSRQFEMRDIDRRKDEFLAMLAHELRNPLAPVSAAAALLKMPNVDTARISQTSDIILRQVRHMTALIDDLLDVSRVSRGLIQLEQEAVDLRQVIPAAVEQIRPLINARKHRLTVELGGAPALVLGDEKRLIQVVANLLNNAAKYTPDVGNIVIMLGISEHEVTVMVTDTGIGMAPSVISHVFDMFAQGARTPDRSQGGLGIGLALVKSLVTMHGGLIEAQSQGSNKGSRFVLRLPRIAAGLTADADGGADSAGPAAAARSSYHRLDRAAATRMLLIVDDNVDAAITLAMLLDTLGYRTAVEHEGASAINSAHRMRPDACLLDIGLPDMDGTQIAAALKASPLTAGATLIAITGYGQEAVAQRALAAGFDYHMVKPVDLDRLLAILARLPAVEKTTQ